MPVKKKSQSSGLIDEFEQKYILGMHERINRKQTVKRTLIHNNHTKLKIFSLNILYYQIWYSNGLGHKFS